MLTFSPETFVSDSLVWLVCCAFAAILTVYALDCLDAFLARRRRASSSETLRIFWAERPFTSTRK